MMIREMVLAHHGDEISASSVLFMFLSMFRDDPAAVLVLVSPVDDAPPPTAIDLEPLVAAARSDARMLRATVGGTPVAVGSSAALLRLFRDAQPEMLAEILRLVAGAPIDAANVARIEAFAALRFERDVLQRFPEHVVWLRSTPASPEPLRAPATA